MNPLNPPEIRIIRINIYIVRNNDIRFYIN